VSKRNLYKRGGTWWVRFKVDGREIRRSLRTSDESVAKRRAEQERTRAVAAHHFGDDRKTYVEVFAAWSEHIIGQVGPKTAKRYGVSLGQLEPFLKPRFFDEIDMDCVAEIVRERRKVASVATVRRDLSALSNVIEFAIGEGWRKEGDNPALYRQKRLKERRDPIVLPLAGDIAAVHSLVPGNLRALCEAAVATGCRQDELVTARPRGFSQDRRQLTVRGKGNKDRTIDLSDEAYRILTALPVYLNGKWLFWHDEGEPYRNVASRYAAYVKAAQESAQRDRRDFHPFRFHDLRHFYAVHFLKNGGNIYALQHKLGHASIKTTELYLKFLTAEEAQIAKFGTAQNPAQ
jgi:integrase/recombinase XerD